MTDFLPLALANLEKKCVMIYTNKEDQPIKKIKQTLLAPEASDIINLAYTSIPTVTEHYGACIVDNNADTQRTGINTERSDEEQNDQTLYATPAQHTNINTTPRKSASYSTPVKRRLVSLHQKIGNLVLGNALD